MGSLNSIRNEIQELGPNHDIVRRRYLSALGDLTKRNTIIYYSAWLEKGHLAARGFDGFGISDSDKNGFMTAVHGLNRDAGLDLILHTPGGDVAATESIIDYLCLMYDNDFRVIVPQLAMSGGTMIALASNEIIMGKHSSLGPIDPQFGGISADAIIEEFKTAKKECTDNPAVTPLWQQVLSKYPPTIVGECEKAVRWAKTIAGDSLRRGMFKGKPDLEGAVDKVLTELADHALTLSHSRHISAVQAKTLGLNVTMLEDHQDLQDAVLSVHHAALLTLGETNVVKMIESGADGSYMLKVEGA